MQGAAAVQPNPGCWVLASCPQFCPTICKQSIWGLYYAGGREKEHLSKAWGAFGAGFEQRVSFSSLRQLCDADRFKPSAARGRASDSLFCHDLSAQPNPGEEFAQLGDISSKLVRKVMPLKNRCQWLQPGQRRDGHQPSTLHNQSWGQSPDLPSSLFSWLFSPGLSAASPRRLPACGTHPPAPACGSAPRG